MKQALSRGRLGRPRFTRDLADVLAFIAVLLAAFGLYPVTSFRRFSQRTPPIKRSHGARRRRVAEVVRFVGRRLTFSALRQHRDRDSC